MRAAATGATRRVLILYVVVLGAAAVGGAGLSTSALAAAGTFQFVSATFQTNETSGDGFLVQLGVSRTGGSDGDMEVLCHTPGGGTATAGIDYNPINGESMFWLPGQTANQFCKIHVNDDTLIEGAETFDVEIEVLSPGMPGSRLTATVTIIDDDSGGGSIQFGSSGYSTAESNAHATFQVFRTGSTAGEVSITATTTGGTAIPGTDYVTTQTILTWASGQGGVKFFAVPLLDDAVNDGDKTLIATLSNVTGGASLSQPSVSTFTLGDTELDPPVVLYVHPKAGPPSGGTEVSIVGYNLHRNVTSVTFGGVPCTQVTSVIKCVTPPHAVGIVDVVVTTTSGTSSTAGPANDFHYSTGTGVPTVKSIGPNLGPRAGGAVVTITGWNFLGATSVTFEGVPCTDPEVVNAGTIRCKTPPQPIDSGAALIAVTTPSGTTPPIPGEHYSYDQTSPLATPTRSGPGATPSSSPTATGGQPAPPSTATPAGSSPTPGTPTPTTTPSATAQPSPADPSAGTFTLHFRFNLIVWVGPDRTPIAQGLSDLDGWSAVWWFDPAEGKFRAYFRDAASPGANDLQEFRFGSGYFIVMDHHEPQGVGSARVGNERPLGVHWSPTREEGVAEATPPTTR